MMYLVLVVATVSLGADVDYHETLDDYHDFDAVMMNPDLLEQHLNCYMDTGPCTDVMSSYKQHIPTFISEACARCNSPQKHMVRVWLDGLEKFYPKGFEKYAKMYDPDNKYLGPLRAAIANF